jgi:hypothetical protein
VQAVTAVNLSQLQAELTAANVPVPYGLGTTANTLETVHTYTATGEPAPLPPDADPILAAHVAPPLVTEFAGTTQVSAIVRTTDAAVREVFRFPCQQRSLYEAVLVIKGIDAGNFAVKRMNGEFLWKRITANAILSGLTVVSDIHDTAAASWAPNYAISGTDVVFTVQGAAGRTIDWILQGSVERYAPAGL